MKLMKMRITMDEQGKVLLPEQLMREAGIKTGEEMEVTLVTGLGEMESICPKLILTREEIGIAMEFPCMQEEEDDLALPAEWLEAAGIPEESDLEVMCTTGAILIKEANRLDNLPEDLKTLFAKLNINPATVREVMGQEGYFV